MTTGTLPYAGHPVVVAAERMMEHLQQAGGAQISSFWRDLSLENLRMLRTNGPEQFKRTVSQNYFNWTIDDPAHPQMQTLLRAWAETPDRMPLQVELHGSAELEGVALSRYVTSPEAARTYTLFVGLLWWFAGRSSPEGLADRISEPDLGAPVDIQRDGQRISQDLANSLREWQRIAPWMQGARPLLAEVGAGYGRVGWVALQAIPCRYWVFDIPPALAVSQWYLTTLFPHKTVFHWRPFTQWEEVRAEAEAADIAFFSIDQLAFVPPRTFDVAAAISMLHEMLPARAVELLQAMADRTARAVYVKNWTTWDNIWDKVVFSSDCLDAPNGTTLAWSRQDDVLPQFTEKLFLTSNA